jgi:hypothetical protein
MESEEDGREINSDGSDDKGWRRRVTRQSGEGIWTGPMLSFLKVFFSFQ